MDEAGRAGGAYRGRGQWKAWQGIVIGVGHEGVCAKAVGCDMSVFVIVWGIKGCT